MRRVRIKKLPQAKAGGQANGYTNTVPEQLSNWGGADVGEYKVPDISTRQTLEPVKREEATIEAEKGEVAYGDINGDNFLETFVIGGERHSNGGTPLNLPEGTFIYSDFRDMIIKDPKLLAMFGKVKSNGKAKKGGLTPAKLAKQYLINPYREILDNPDSDKHDRMTAELMIEEYQDKLGALAIAQESMKNFEQGIPQVARPYMEKRGLNDQDIIPQNQIQGAQPQEAPMARYGGGLNSMPMAQLNRFIPRAQNGLEKRPVQSQPTDQMNWNEQNEYLKNNPNLSNPANWTEEQKLWWDKLNQYNINREKFDKVVPLNPTRPMEEEEQRNYEKNFNNRMHNRLDWGEPNPGYLQRSMDAIDDCPCMKKVPVPLANGQMMMEDRCVPCEEMGQARSGGQLKRYQKAGEVTYKTYEEDDLPEGTVIKDYYSPFTVVGDYVRLADGTIRKVKNKKMGPTQTTETSQGTIDDYIATDEGRANTDRANAIIEQGIADGTIKELGNGNIRILGTFKPSFKDRILLSRTLNASGKKFGTDKYKVAKQSFTEGYSKPGKAKGSGNFVAGFTPEDYEKRFMFELMTGSGASDDDAFNRIDEIYADPQRKIQARRMYLNTLGIEGVEDLSDDELLSEDYYKNNYAKVTKGIEQLDEKGYRPVIGNEQLSGFEHFDALGISPSIDYEGEDPVVEEEEDDDDPDNPYLPQKPAGRAPWWLQDEVNIAGNIIDRSRIKKYLPWAPGVDLEEMDPTFLDPTGAVNAQNAAGAASLQALSQFTGPQAASARAMGIQGQMADQAAQTINAYDTQNVGIANQFEEQNVGIRNQERIMDAQRAGNLFDQNTIANQQYDNSMLQLRREGRGLYNQAVTNRWKTDALNQMYPDYAVDPSVGGQMYHDPTYRDPKPIKDRTFDTYLQEYKKQGMADKEAIAAAKAAMTQGQGGYMGPDLDIMNAQYQQNGGLVMGSNVFPFMFY